MSTTSLIDIGISGLKAQQAALATTGHNITNANTPGYSRQRVEITPQPAQFSGVGYLGTGASLESVTRVVDEFAVNQVRLDTAAFSEIDSYLSQISQVDSLLADELTGLVPALQSFFGSMQAASSDPGSIPSRQLVLSEATGLVGRFNTMYERLDAQQRGLDDLMSTVAESISVIARSVAALNDRIAGARGDESSPPNDLLDQRDEQLKKLAELVAVRVVPQSDGQVSVFIGKGQPLVLGQQVASLSVDSDGDVNLVNGADRAAQMITSSISGGQLGGLIEFRDGILDGAMNQLGRIAITVSDLINAQHREGVTLDGLFGGDLFSSVNLDVPAHQRATAIDPSPFRPAGSIAVYIDDAAALTVSDYQLEFAAGDETYFLKRLSDDEIVAQGNIGNGLPSSVVVDGFELVIEDGIFQAGDRYLIQPTRTGAQHIGRVIDNAKDLAFSSPVRVDASLGNRGTGIVKAAGVFDADSAVFGATEQLTPPLMIRFTSETTYEVLDASDPAAPRSLTPPLRDLVYVPGIENTLLPGGLGQTLVASDGGNVQRLPGAAQVVVGLAALSNGYTAENLEVAKTDPASGTILSTQSLSFSAGTSARTIADQLSGLDGARASAQTELHLSQLNDDGAGIPLAIAIGGQRFTGADAASLDALADAITANVGLSALGIEASSDGVRLTLRSTHGDDLAIYVSGDPSDGVRVDSPNGDMLDMTGAGAGVSARIAGTANVSGGYDFSVGGPYQFSLSADESPSVSVDLTATYASGAALVAGLQGLIDASPLGPGRVNVSLNGSGQVVLTSSAAGAAGSLAISGAPAGSAIDLALGITDASVTGEDSYQAISVGGSVSVLLDADHQLTSNAATVSGNVFSTTPGSSRADFGFQATMTGRPVAGDRFVLEFSGGGVADNRNVLAMTDIQSQRLFGGGEFSIFDAYADMVEFVGSKTHQARIDRDASEGLLRQSQGQRDSISGVNLDEEAGNLIRFEQAYNASARVIAVARDTFDVLFNMVR